MLEVQAPDPFFELPEKYDSVPRVFLAGSIDNGKARSWQRDIIQAFSEADVVFLNPRRADWNSSWEPIASNPEFREQVEWELDAIDEADLVVFYFDPDGTAPVSMLELGLLVSDRERHVLVCCPDGFYRQGNIEIVCERTETAFTTEFSELLRWIQDALS